MCDEETQKSEVINEAEAKPIITNPVKTKNPKRVEQGKRLAQISKQAKERKMRERVDAEVTKRIKAVSKRVEHREDTEHSDDDEPSTSSEYTSAIEYVVLPTGIVGLVAYLVYKKYIMPRPVQKVPEVQKDQKEQPTSNFISPD